MTKFVRTTITIPEQIYRQSKIRSSLLKESFSAYVTACLQKGLKEIPQQKTKKITSPKKILGAFSLGINKIPSRQNIYEKTIRRKLGR